MKKIFHLFLCFIFISLIISCERKETIITIEPDIEIGNGNSETPDVKLSFEYNDNINDSTGAMYCKDKDIFILYGSTGFVDPLTNTSKKENYFCLARMSDNKNIDEESALLVLTDSIGMPKHIISKEGNIILEKNEDNNFDVLYLDTKENTWKELENISLPFNGVQSRSSAGSVPTINASGVLSGAIFLNNLINAFGIRGVNKAILGYWGMHVDLLGALNPNIGLAIGLTTDILVGGKGVMTIISYLLAKQEEYNKLLRKELGNEARLLMHSAEGYKDCCRIIYTLTGLEKSASVLAYLHKVTDNDIYDNPNIAGMTYEPHILSSNAQVGTFGNTISGLKTGKYNIYLSLRSNKYKNLSIKTSPDLIFYINYVSVETGECTYVTDKTATVNYSVENSKPGVSIEMQYIAEDEKTVQKISLSPTDGDNQVILTNLKPATKYTYKIVAYEEGKTIKGKDKTFTTELPDISGSWTCTEEYYNGWDYTKKLTKSYAIVLNPNGTADVNDGSTYVSSSWSFNSKGQVTVNINNISTQTQDIGTMYEGTVNDIKNPTSIEGGRYTWAYNQVIGYVRHDDYHTITMTR